MTSFIGHGTIDWLRGLQAGFYPATCSISRYTETNTPDGVEHAWSTVASDIPCRVDVRQTASLEGAGQGGVIERSVSAWVLWLPALTDVTERDRVTVGAPDGRVFEVQQVGAKPSSYETTRRLLCALIDEGTV